MINGGRYERYLSVWFTRPWLLSCCKLIYFTAYLIGTVFLYLCNIVKFILRTPLRSLCLFLGLIVGPFMYCTNRLWALDLMMYIMWLWSINFYNFILLSLTIWETLNQYSGSIVNHPGDDWAYTTTFCMCWTGNFLRILTYFYFSI